MSRRIARIFNSCGKAVRITLANGKSTSGQIARIKLGRRILLRFISDLASDERKHRDPVERAMHDLHPRTEYCTAMIIRDLADICVTLSRLEQGRRRSDRQKLLDAALYCEFLTDEFEPVANSD